MIKYLNKFIAIYITALFFILAYPLHAADLDSCFRIVVLSDLHYPVKTIKAKKERETQQILAAKAHIVDVINSWNDTGLIAVTGDLAGTTGTPAEFSAVKNYLQQFKFPVCAVTGNHDFMYQDTLNKHGKVVKASSEIRTQKLNNCLLTYNMPGFCYTQEVNGYLLVFLSADDTESVYPVALSQKNLVLFQHILATHSSMPTIVFYHAPLQGTTHTKNGKPSGKDKTAQPQKAISDILSANPQVFMWISGHTHTPPDSPDFMAPYNLWHGTVEDIFNTDLDRIASWSNSLYLYRDHVEVKTFSFEKNTWLPQFDRSIFLPACVISGRMVQHS